MRVLTQTELMRLTTTELCALMAQIAAALRDYPAGSAERENALSSLRNICRVLAGREMTHR
jgi:hypothetical protein